MPLGANVAEDGVNFSIFSRHAKSVSLLLFHPDNNEPKAVIKLDKPENRTGDIWHVLVEGLAGDELYGYQVDGPNDVQQSGHYFSSDKVLLDPYARALSDGESWGLEEPNGCCPLPAASWVRRCRIVWDDFDWEGDRPLQIPMQDTIIYELNVRGYTKHTSSGVKHPGTYAGLVEKIPYIKKLGVTAVELLPVAEFNENEIIRRNPITGERLRNLWGYSTMAFFAPKAGYAADAHNGNQVREFKELVKAFHKAGIEVILDVVFNHTAEGGADGPVLSFRGLDNTIYYMLDPETRDYMNFSGCGNTMNCNHPVVRRFIIDCLHYWVTEMHVDGFRFDLASIMGRDTEGQVLADPPMVDQIAEDPLLADTKIIAEAWDAGHLYQVGMFSGSPRWAEWNGHFRDDVRGFLCGKEDMVRRLATRLAGSSDLYQRSNLSPLNSINFVTSHDGFTLCDLVSYHKKRNRANGEDNRDGSNYEISWNSGVEGETRSTRIKGLRNRRVRSFAAILFLSQGVPMMLAGDEFGRSQKGNNNTYCQDNVIGWIDWGLAKKNRSLLRFFTKLIAFRKAHAAFRRTTFFVPTEDGENDEIRWQSLKMNKQDWSTSCKALAFFLDGSAVSPEPDNDFFVAINSHKKPKAFDLPKPKQGCQWRIVIDTAAPSPHDIVPEDQGVVVDTKTVAVASMAVVVLVA